MDINYYGPDDVKVFLDDESNNLIDISEVVQSIGDLGKEAKLADESQGFGKAWVEVLAIGVRMVKEVALEVWFTGPNTSASANTIARIGTRAILKGVPKTPRDKTRTMRIVYGMPIPEPTEKTGGMVNNGAGYTAGARTLAVDNFSTAPAVGEFYEIGGEAYELTAASANSITLHRGLLRAVADDAPIKHIREFFGECEAVLRDTGPALDRANGSMIKTAIRPSGELVEY